MSGTMRTIGRLAAVLAVALTVAGLMAGGAAAERPAAENANTEIEFCVSRGGEVDAWIREDGSSINVTCTFDDYMVFCQFSDETPMGGCLTLDRLAPDPGSPGPRTPAIPRDQVPVPNDKHA